jgi:hypothetical protein
MSSERAIKPSIALSAMRTNSAAGSSSSGHRSSRRHAIAPPTASDIATASSVTWFGRMPAWASWIITGRNNC